MIIRKATIKDFESLKEIKILSKREELKYSDTLKSIDRNKKNYFSYLKKDLTHKNRAVFIALDRLPKANLEKMRGVSEHFDNKKVIGMILAQYFEPLPI